MAKPSSDHERAMRHFLQQLFEPYGLHRFAWEDDARLNFEEDPPRSPYRSLCRLDRGVRATGAARAGLFGT
jgi:hypothetical protein